MKIVIRLNATGINKVLTENSSSWLKEKVVMLNRTPLVLRLQFFGTMRLFKILIFRFCNKLHFQNTFNFFFNFLVLPTKPDKTKGPPFFYNFRHCEIFQNEYCLKIWFSLCTSTLYPKVVFIKTVVFRHYATFFCRSLTNDSMRYCSILLHTNLLSFSYRFVKTVSSFC